MASTKVKRLRPEGEALDYRKFVGCANAGLSTHRDEIALSPYAVAFCFGDGGEIDVSKNKAISIGVP